MSKSPFLLTDLYQLTMAQGYWKSGLADRDAVFHLFFRATPFGSGYAIAAGLEPALELLRNFAPSDDDIGYLRSLELFDDGFLRYLRTLKFACDVDAIPEGTVVFAQEPLLRVTGPILHAQLVETALLNIINFQTLIATKAARTVLAAGGTSVLEFGLRRAQGPDGGLSAARAAYIGGVDATSNVLAGRELGIPVRGTHAHSWVMAFDSEPEAFRAYAEAMPNNAMFLVDTYDTLEGVRHAIEVGRELRRRGFPLQGIRLDSGDLAFLSREARRLLDEAGFPDAKIVASNDLDETIITSLRQQNAAIDIWGVGTKLVTAFDQPALGGVYKLGAIRDESGAWEARVKVSEQAAKTTIPGVLQVRRFTSGGVAQGDMIFDPHSRAGTTIVDPADPTRRKPLAGCEWRDLLVPVMRRGAAAYAQPPLGEIRETARRELAGFHEGVKRLQNPHEYPVGLDEKLHERRMAMILAARERFRV